MVTPVPSSPEKCQMSPFPLGVATQVKGWGSFGGGQGQLLPPTPVTAFRFFLKELLSPSVWLPGLMTGVLSFTPQNLPTARD